MRTFSFSELVLALALALLSCVGAGCDTEDPTAVVVDNTYADAVVYRVWWKAVLFADPVLANESSAEQRGIPATDTAYALLAPGWDPASGAPPSRLLVFKSKEPLSVARGATLRITVADATFAGSCPAGSPLLQSDADFITQRIFPSDFTGATYDAATCTVRRAPPDAGAE